MQSATQAAFSLLRATAPFGVGALFILFVSGSVRISFFRSRKIHIENNLHWQLDSSFEEDQITTMDSKAFNNLSLIHKMALTLCKIAKPALKCPSINVFRKLIGWDFDKTMAALFSLFDEDSLKLALTDSNAKESNIPIP